jgi:hypothetical protein
MEPTSKSGKTVLGTFLDNVEPADRPTTQQTSSPDSPPAEPPAAAAATAEPPSLGPVLRYLVQTADSGKDVTISDIAAELQAPTVITADIVQKMAYGGLVTMDGEPGREFVHLTDQGRGLTSVA